MKHNRMRAHFAGILVSAICGSWPGNFRQESHIGGLTGEASRGKQALPALLRRMSRSARGRSRRKRPWIDPKPRDFVAARSSALHADGGAPH